MPGRPAIDSIRQTLELATALEAFGYSRYWLTEHHTPDVAHGSPELMIPLLASATKEMRVGVAGVLLRHHNPYKIARDFGLLETLFPSRIDLGIARGSVTGQVRHELPLEGQPTLEEKVGHLLALLRNRPDEMGFTLPQIWMLGIQRGAASAAEHGISFSLALFMSQASELDLANLTREYRRHFRPSEMQSRPLWSVAVAGVCGPTRAEARNLVRHERENGLVATLVGDAQDCLAHLAHLREVFETNDFVFLDLCEQPHDKFNSYARLARAVGLSPRHDNNATAKT